MYAAGKLLATYTNSPSEVDFVMTDWQGTKRVTLHPDGSVATCWTSLAYGNNLTSCGGSGYDPTNLHFTGKERDVESGNDYFGARYYSSTNGRFMSPDPKMGSGHAANPQSWNRYSYSLGNTLRFIDPDGEEAILFYRPPDPNKGSMEDFGHVFLFVRNDMTGRSGFFDYYPVPGRSAVHRAVSASRIAEHAALIIQSTPEAEDRMLDKMDELTKKNPTFNAGKGGGWFTKFWNAWTGNVNDCVTMTEQILASGGIYDSSSTPTWLWNDLYIGYSNDPDLQTELGLQNSRPVWRLASPNHRLSSPPHRPSRLNRTDFPYTKDLRSMSFCWLKMKSRANSSMRFQSPLR